MTATTETGAERVAESLSQKTVIVDGVTYHVAEGDLLLDADELLLYAEERAELEQERRAQKRRRYTSLPTPTGEAFMRAELVAVTQNGKVVRWKPGTVLSYCVLKNTFTSDQQYQIARNAVQSATGDWEKTCGVTFQYRADLDTQPGPAVSGVLFTVRGIDAQGRFIAAAFFPNDPPNRRRVLIDPSFFSPTLSFDRVGVLRHELGHVLGFRHEHIRSEAPPQCPDEPTFDTKNLTKYDPRSVMHYFCGSVGSASLSITDVDRTGSQSVYGPPLNAFTEFSA